MKTNKAGIELLKKFEGTGPVKKGMLHAYLCPAGIWTIGYGSTFLADGSPVTKNQKPITFDEAEVLLASTLTSYERTVSKYVKVPLTENQFSALVSFVYNVGAANFANSTLLKRVNAKDFGSAAKEFLKWDKARVNGTMVALPGLTKRRQAESILFATP